MENTRNIMVDLEYLGKGSNAAIAAVGAVYFDPCAPDAVILDTFYHRVDVQSSVDAGMALDVGTIRWWMQQDRDAQLSTFGDTNTQAPALHDVLLMLTSFIVDKCVVPQFPDYDHIRFYSHATDAAILRNAYELSGLRAPWSRRKALDLWTITELVRTMHRREIDSNAMGGTKHDALADAVFQAEYVSEMSLLLSTGEGEGVYLKKLSATEEGDDVPF